ncbi:MAG: hypothetical protein JW847_07785 [Candidatus Omnitrophica bacterium]|nr:hypothetical protein [Candidatus Omnitrophota bacterium]
MSKYRKNKDRNKAKHHRQLWKQRQRKLAREERIYSPADADFGVILKTHKREVFLFVLMAVGVMGIILSGPDKDSMNKMSASVSSEIEQKSLYWEEAYPFGFKVIAFMGTDIVQTDFDTLPEDLKINWKNLSVVRIQTRQDDRTVEKIKISISGIQYEPANVSDVTITTTLVRNRGASALMTRFNDLEFVAEIIEDKDDQVYCLFGLREG